jgi:hypothetical protein
MQPVIFIVVFICGIMLGVRANMAMNKNTQIVQSNVHNVADILACTERLKDYQIYLSIDSVYLYDNGKLIGTTAHGNDGIDSLIMLDNQ